MQSENNEIIEKLKKLIRHERSAREIGNVAEAAAFAAKIQAFVDKYNIELSKINIDIEHDQISNEHVIAECKQKWLKIFLVNIAKINGCSVMFSSDGYKIYGTNLDIALVNTFYEYFADLGLHLQKLAIISYKVSGTYRRKRKKHRATIEFKESFGFGFTLALIRRLKEQQNKSTSGSHALIFIGNKLAKAEHAMEGSNQIREEKVSLTKKRLNNPAFDLGSAAGNSVALTPNTVTGSQTSLLD